MSGRKYMYGACHYCICTACSRLSCPFKHYVYRECFVCRQRSKNRPRLDCDFFRHYIKSRTFRFRPAARPLPEHRGSYVLTTGNAFFVGSYEKLEPLRKRLGCELKQLYYLDFLGGADYDKR